METTDHKVTASINDFQEYSAILDELFECQFFIADTCEVLESFRFDGENGELTPLYETQLLQLVRKATCKQVELMTRLTSLTDQSLTGDHDKRGLLDLPAANERVYRRVKDAS